MKRVYVVLKRLGWKNLGPASRDCNTGDVCCSLRQWSSVLSGVVTEQERMLPILLDLLDTNNDAELRPLTGLLRNLARHSPNKDHMGKGQRAPLLLFQSRASGKKK